jgi:hypothetical protein
MSIKTKLVTAATALTVMAGVGATATLTANAATPKCGALCSDFYSAATGTGWVLDAPAQVGQAGQLLTLARASRASKSEDFVVQALGTVSDFHEAGLVSRGLNALYGGLSVYEIEYAPGASNSFLCLGTSGTPGAAGAPVALEPCGVQASTLWIFTQQKTSTGTYNVLISAATSRNFQDPDVLTTLAPGTSLVAVPQVAGTSSAFAHQLWNWKTGVLPTS